MTEEKKGLHKMNQKMRGFVCTIIGAVCWGFSGTCGQYLMQNKGISSLWLTCMRMLIAGVVLAAWSIVTEIVSERKMTKASEIEETVNTGTTKSGIWGNGQDICQLLLFSIFGLTVCQYTYLTAISCSNAGTATVLQYLGPVMIMVYVCIRAGRLPTKYELISIILAVGGTFLLATHGNLTSLAISGEALLWGLLAALGLVLYTLLPGKMIAKYGSSRVTGYGMLTGGIVLTVLVRPWRYHIVWDMGVVLGTLVIGVLGTAAAYTLYLQGVQDIGSVNASILASIEPVSATVFSALWLKTVFEAVDIAGFACILMTVFLLAKRDKKR